MLNHFLSLQPVDMIFKTTREGEVIPVRFRISGFNGNSVCEITGYRQVEPKGEYPTPDGFYLSRDTKYYDVAFSTEYERNHRINMYYDKQGTCWYVSRKQHKTAKA